MKPDMDNYQEETYGERIAGIYDELYTDHDPAAITALNQLAQGGRALELGIGTGRIALPLQQTGIDVHGIDASESMIVRLRAKPGGERIPVVMGNFADVAVEGRYHLIYVLFNTFYALLTQAEQLHCMRNVAQHLEQGGVFVVEAFVPDLTRFARGQSVRAVTISDDRVQIDVSQHDPVAQQVVSQHLMFSEQGTRLFPVKLRYVWPAEFDLMARLAGMQLKHRWSDWRGGVFSAESGKHISVFELAS